MNSILVPRETLQSLVDALAPHAAYGRAGTRDVDQAAMQKAVASLAAILSAPQEVVEPVAHICILPTRDAGPAKFFTSPSDPRGFPVYRNASPPTQPASQELEALRADAERLDWLDQMNARLNKHYGTTYRWKLVLSPNVVRLMTGVHGKGYVGDVDLHDSSAQGAGSCREAIDAARKGAP